MYTKLLMGLYAVLTIETVGKKIQDGHRCATYRVENLDCQAIHIGGSLRFLVPLTLQLCINSSHKELHLQQAEIEKKIKSCPSCSATNKIDFFYLAQNYMPSDYDLVKGKKFSKVSVSNTSASLIKDDGGSVGFFLFIKGPKLKGVRNTYLKFLNNQVFEKTSYPVLDKAINN